MNITLCLLVISLLVISAALQAKKIMPQLDHVEVEKIAGYQMCKYARQDIALYYCRSYNRVAVQITGILGIGVIICIVLKW